MRIRIDSVAAAYDDTGFGGLLTLLGTIVQSSGRVIGCYLTIGARCGPWVGVAVSSLLFRLPHMVNLTNDPAVERVAACSMRA